MNNNINFTLREEIPESSKYHKLFETTGWNKGYEAEKNELHKSVSNSWYSSRNATRIKYQMLT
jgi:hypothetical protein